MPLSNSEQLSPREHFLIDNENQQGREMRQHALNVKQLEIDAQKVEFELRRVDAEKSRQHQESMKELELAIRTQETQWGQLLRIPLTIIKLPIFALFGVAFCISMITKQDLPADFWRFLR